MQMKFSQTIPVIMLTGILTITASPSIAQDEATADAPVAPEVSTSPDESAAHHSESAMADSEPAMALPEPAPRGPKAVEFYALTDQLIEVIKKVNTIRQEYPVADEARKSELGPEYQQLLEQGNQLQHEQIDLAKAAYQEAPNADLEILNFLLTICSSDVHFDNYERGYELAKMVIETDFAKDNPSLYALAGMAAFSTNRYDDAEKWWKTADEAGLISFEGYTKPDDVPQWLNKAADLLNDPAKFRDRWAREQAFRKSDAEADDLPRVLMSTDAGDITFELFENEAPNTVASFISLVEDGYYDETPFHRVLPNFMAQGGDPTGSGSGGPGYTIRCEVGDPNHREHFRGSLSMAHAGPNTGGSQFFLTFLQTTHLDGRHTVFGRVIDGMDVLGDIKRRDPENPTGGDPDTIIKATVIRKRDHDYTPVTNPGM